MLIAYQAKCYDQRCQRRLISQGERLLLPRLLTVQDAHYSSYQAKQFQLNTQLYIQTDVRYKMHSQKGHNKMSIFFSIPFSWSMHADANADQCISCFTSNLNQMGQVALL